MAETKIKAAQFHGVVGHGTDGYFLMTNADGSMSWAQGGASGPSVTSVTYPGDDLAADPAGAQSVVLTGTNFGSSMSVTIGGTTAPSVAHDSSTQLTITTPAKAAGDYDIVVTNTVTGTSGTFVNGISYNGVPTWTTAAGSLGTFESETTISTITLAATEPDGGTITFNITNGALPTGLSLTGANIDGTTTAESSTTLYSFTIEAIDDENQATPRNFSITVNSAEIVPSQNFTINTYTGNGSTQSIEGKIGTAADFNGSSSYISFSSPYSHTTDNEDLSISGWFKVPSLFTSGYQSILGGDIANSSGNGGTVGLLLRYKSAGKYLIDFTRIFGTSARYHSAYTSSDEFTLTANTWTHFAFTYEGSDVNKTNKLYINGSLVYNITPNTFTTSGNNTNSTLAWGKYRDSLAFFNGSLDQLRLFNRVLDETNDGEVTTLYNEPSNPGSASTTDIFDDGSGVALYEFEEGAKDTGLPLNGYTPIANRTFESSKSTSAQSTGPRDFEFSSDGTKLFFCDGSNNRIHQYTMTTAWDVSTASHNGYYDVTGQISGGVFPISVQFKSDGTKMYVSTYAASPERIYEYDLSNAWVVTSGVTYNSKFGNTTVQAWGMEFNSTGTVLICSSDTASGNLCKYTLSTAWDISTISLSQQITLTSIKGIDLSPDGKQLLGAYFPGSGSKTIKSYSLSTAYDITTLTQREEWDVNSTENTLQTVTCKFDGSNKIDKLYFVGFQQDTIYGYDIDETADFIIGYDGTPTNVSFVGTSFQPDAIWIKSRDNARNHRLNDSLRVGEIYPNLTNQESSFVGISSYDSNGFTIGTSDPNYNANNEDYVAWCWRAAGAANTYNVLEGGTVTSDSTASGAGITAGTITTGWEVSANRDAGFSIVSYTGNGTAGATVGHGLSSPPELIISKNRDEAQSWIVNATAIGKSKILTLNTSGATLDRPNQYYYDWNDTTITMGSDIHINGLNDKIITYCFHSVDEYQKVGSYSGNSTSGRLIDTGFQPRFVMIKTTNATSNWFILDALRGGTQDLRANSNADEETRTNGVTFVSNGFEIDDTSVGFNNSSTNYIYLAIA